MAESRNGTKVAPPAPDMLPMFLELGTTGLKQYGGYVKEEYLRQLQGSRGMKVYREMTDDPVVGSILFAIEMLVRQVPWRIVPADHTVLAQEHAAFVDGMFFRDMSQSWPMLLSEIMSFLPYGFSFHEQIFKRRLGMEPPREYKRDDPLWAWWAPSQFDDGLLAWRKLPIRAQDTLLRWEFDAGGGVRAMVQQDPVRARLVTIPIDKALLFRGTSHKGNPEGRALAIDTPIPTPDGWTTMGGIAIGDKVYDEIGHMRYVIAKSEVWCDRPVYKIEFSSGHAIVADANHVWSVTTYNDRHNKLKPRLLSTHDLYDLVNRDVKSLSFSAGIAPVLDATNSLLPLDPYILGYWLGDGNSDNGHITIHKDDFSSLAKEADDAGFESSFDGDRGAHISGIKPLLRAMDVLQNKHIPPAYLRAHWTQRLALLQGLMDSDGSSGKGKDRSSYFGNSNPLLIQQFCELVRSLGGRPYTKIWSHPGRMCGTINGKTIIQRKTFYAVSFYLHLPIHRLQRKLVQQDMKDSHRVRGHFIKAIRYIGQADTACIQVDSPSQLFLAGIGLVPTHNSAIRSAFSPWYMKKNLERIEGIGIERDLAGLPVAYAPVELFGPSLDVNQKAQMTALKNIVTNIRQDEQAGLVFPLAYDQNGKERYKIELLSTGGAAKYDTDKVIRRYDTRIAQVTLADVIMLGHTQIGTQALGEEKDELFALAITGFLEAIAEVFNRYGIPRVWLLNALPSETMPQLTYGKIRKVDFDKFTLGILRLAQAGLDLSQDVDHIRMEAGFPERVAEEMGL